MKVIAFARKVLSYIHGIVISGMANTTRNSTKITVISIDGSTVDRYRITAGSTCGTAIKTANQDVCNLAAIHSHAVVAGGSPSSIGIATNHAVSIGRVTSNGKFVAAGSEIYGLRWFGRLVEAIRNIRPRQCSFSRPCCARQRDEYPPPQRQAPW